MKSKCQSGFTLLEVLIALAVLGLVFIGFGTVQQQQLKTLQHMEQRLAAAQLSANLLIEYRLTGAPVLSETLEGETRMAGRTFQWRRSVDLDRANGLLKVVIRIGLQNPPIYQETWSKPL